MSLLSFLLILENTLSLQDIVVGVLVIAAGLITFRTNFFKDIFSSSKTLLENKSKLLEIAEKELKEYKDENRILRREVTQRMEITQQDQETIRELRKHEQDTISRR